MMSMETVQSGPMWVAAHLKIPDLHRKSPAASHRHQFIIDQALERAENVIVPIGSDTTGRSACNL